MAHSRRLSEIYCAVIRPPILAILELISHKCFSATVEGLPIKRQFSRQELQLIRRLDTPDKVQRFLCAMRYNGKETMRTFRGVSKHQESHCLEAALFAATVLEQHGLPPLLLDIGSQDGLGHVLFLYQRRGRWGSIGRSRDPGLHGRKPAFATIREMVDSYALPFVDMSGRVVDFAQYDLRDLRRCDWRLSARNVWLVERTLIQLPHKKYHMPEDTYWHWYHRYRKFKERYPDRKPIFYPDRSTWAAGYPRQ